MYNFTRIFKNIVSWIYWLCSELKKFHPDKCNRRPCPTCWTGWDTCSNLVQILTTQQPCRHIGHNVIAPHATDNRREDHGSSLSRLRLCALSAEYHDCEMVSVERVFVKSLVSHGAFRGRTASGFSREAQTCDRTFFHCPNLCCWYVALVPIWSVICEPTYITVLRRGTSHARRSRNIIMSGQNCASKFTLTVVCYFSALLLPTATTRCNVSWVSRARILSLHILFTPDFVQN